MIHRVQDMMRLMAHEIEAVSKTISDMQVQSFVDEILASGRIYVMGAGRSGLVAKAFAMRLMHLGLTSYVVGETITPALLKGDLVIVLSGSGQTRTIAEIAETAKSIGGRVALVTSNPDSAIGKLADATVVIAQHREDVPDDSVNFDVREMLGEHRSFAPLGTFFETASMTFCDAVISYLMEERKIDEAELKGRHANIE